MLITANQVKNYLGITSNDYNTILTTLCSYGQRFFEKMIGYTLDEGTITEYIDGMSFMRTARKPITTVISVEYNSGTTATPNWITANRNDYEYYPEQGCIKFFRVYQGYRNVKIVYIAGYTITTVPDDIVLALVKMVARIWEKRKSEGMTSESLEGANINWSKFLDEDTLMIIDQYKLKVL